MCKRFFVPDGITSVTEISGAEFHHIADVMRIPAGGEIVLFCGDGFDYRARVTAYGRKSLTAEIIEKTRVDNEPHIRLALFQAAIKPEKFERVIVKAAELGAVSVTPLLTAYSQFPASSFSPERMSKIAVSAAKQCGRAVLVGTEPPVKIAALGEKLKGFDTVIMPYEYEKNNTLKDALRGKNPKSVAVIIGCEGGFSEDEAALCGKFGALTVTLGPRIMRAETAGAAVTAAIMYELDEWVRQC
ncbi:MAG: 16S rRNA (uracil(1498)-N(3))-methyltransferase [Clostridiales bacterium]|jgi:16S rRNA (uracil1498-N3)-methyltransferase|nr:16S rRNA (uracil(1498)-N(3))-methyltransferase [Clostridiales bacterium]